MSIVRQKTGVENVKVLCEKSKYDEEIRSELNRIFSEEAASNFANAIVALGKKHSLEFNEDDYEEARNQAISQRPVDPKDREVDITNRYGLWYGADR